MLQVNSLFLSAYRREFSAPSKHRKNNNHSAENTEQTDSLLEINTNLNKDSTTATNQKYLQHSTIDILKGTTLTSMPSPKLVQHYDSAVPSPFLDKKQQQMQMLIPNTPQLKPRAVSPTNSEEHQYDIPFSHLGMQNRLIQDIEPYETESPRPQHKVQNHQQRRSRSSNRTSSGTSQSK